MYNHHQKPYHPSTSSSPSLGIEIQADLSHLSNELTKRCNIPSEYVQFITGDFLDDNILHSSSKCFDAAVSWLVILHIPLKDRSKLFKKCFDILKPGGMMYIEDFYIKSPSIITEIEKKLLMNEVAVPNGELPTKDEYISTVKDAGFTVEFEDKTDEWTEFTTSRMNQWISNKERHVNIHGIDTWSSIDRFYSSVSTLFNGGNLAGVSLLLTKP